MGSDRSGRLRWLTAESSWSLVEAALAGVVVAVASSSLAGLALGMAGVWSPVAALAVGAVPTIVLVGVLVRRGTGADRHATAPLGAAVALVLAVTVFWAAQPSQHVLVNRDPGSYTTTAVHLAATGDLRVDQRGTPFDEVAALPEAATYVTGPGTYEFQFNHLLSAVMALAYSLVGPGAMFRLPALFTGLGLLAVYLLAVRLCRRPWLSLAAPAALGLSLPMLYVARDTFSESLTFLLLWTGLLVSVAAIEQRRPSLGAVAGWLFGAAIAARIDALVYAVALAPLLVIWAGLPCADRPQRVKTATAFSAAALLPVVLGQVDLQWFTGDYVNDLGAEVALLRIGVVAAALGGVVALVAHRRFAPFDPLWRDRTGLAAAVLLAALLVGLWFVRPVVTQTRYPERPALTGYQAAEGVPVDATRSHHEFGFVWMEWYLGPVVVALAVLGLALLARRAVRGRASPPELVVLAVGIIAGLLYWWRPSIFADQPWASRRFMPAIYPAAALAAVLALRDAARTLLAAGSPHRHLLVGCVAAAMLVPVGATTWPVRDGRTQAGYLAPILTTCELLGDTAAVVVVEQNEPRRLAPAVRAWCGAPTISLADPSAEGLDRLAAAWAERDTTLWIVSDDPELLGPYLDDSEPLGSAVGHGSGAIERTLTRPPQRYRPPEPFRVWLHPVQP